jgi:hypothetical protein
VEKNITVSIYLPVKVVAVLDQEAKKEDRNRSSYLNRLLRRHFKMVG